MTDPDVCAFAVVPAAPRSIVSSLPLIAVTLTVSAFGSSPIPIRNGAVPLGKFSVVVSFAVVAPELIGSASLERASGKIATTPQ